MMNDTDECRGQFGDSLGCGDVESLAVAGQQGRGIWTAVIIDFLLGEREVLLLQFPGKMSRKRDLV